ncbi:MAG: tripartite tricarboxylate transporter substrate binding protein [Betaproteobacteria bacterium]|nr:tripartite tricarboxylate transporter substrate binding protein [Betaproteobacteria bacterium]
MEKKLFKIKHLETFVGALTAAVGFAAHAQDYPAKPIRIVVPFPAGGAVDTLARALATPLQRSLGQNVVIENRTGANTVIGTEQVARAPADGYTMLPYDSLKDFTGVTRLVYNPLIYCAHPSLPVKNMKDLVALAKKHPGELTWGVSSIIGGGRIAGELFHDLAGIKMINVPYGGGAPATVALLGGHTSLLVGNVLDCSQHIGNGRVRGVAVTSLKRADILPQVATIAESGWPGFEALNWFGAVVRAGTPRTVVDRLSNEIGKALQLPEVRDIFAKQGFTIGNMSPAQFDAYILN